MSPAPWSGVDAAVTVSSVGVEHLDDLLEQVHDVEEEHGVSVSAVDARYVVSERHLLSAAAKARRSFERGENVADGLSMEVLLYVAGSRQIDVATKLAAREGAARVAFVCTMPVEADDDEIGGVEDGSYEAAARELERRWNPAEIGPDEERVREFYGVSDEELDAVGRDRLELLVLERVALLDVEK